MELKGPRLCHLLQSALEEPAWERPDMSGHQRRVDNDIRTAAQFVPS